jgi:hypothetical protein
MPAAKSRTAKKWLLAVLFLASVVALIRGIWPRERRLLALAQPIVQLTDEAYFAWLSEHELLLYHNVTLPTGDGYRLSRFDVNTRQETPLHALSGLFNRYHGYPEAGQVSPDGTRLLWAGNTGKQQRRRTSEEFCAISATLEGKQPIVQKIGSWLATDALVSNNIRWMPDGQHWAEFEAGWHGSSMHIYPLDSSQKKQTLPLSTTKTLGDMDDLYVTPERLLSAENPFFLAKDRPPMQIKEFSLLPSPTLRQTYQMHLPAEIRDAEDHFVWAFSLQPKTNSIAYIVDYTYQDLWRQKWSRVLPFLAVPVQHVSGLWVSRLDGTKAYEVGHVLLSPNTDDNPTFRYLQWSPDGKRIGFLYDGRVYIVNAK